MEGSVSKEGDGAEQALSSGEQELRLLVDVVIGAVTRIVESRARCF
jgi:hypothetical protein